MRRWALTLLGSFALLASNACDEDSTEGPTDGAPVASASTAAPPGDLLAVGAARAFDLVVTDEGAVLVRARARSEGGGVDLARLTPEGYVRQWVLIAGGNELEIEELRAASRGNRLAIVWLERNSRRWRVRATTGSSKRRVFAPIAELGAGAEWGGGRGHVAAAAAESIEGASGAERFVAFHQGAPEPCSDGSGSCTPFVLHELGPSGATPRRVALSVPSACSAKIAGFAVTGHRWYYGVCSIADGKPGTTMFTIEHSPEYAQAETLLAGCLPAGLSVIGDQALLVGDCEGHRRAMRVGSRLAPPAPVDLDGLSASCWNDHLRLRAPGRTGLQAVLEEPTDRLGLLLPSRIGPWSARAAWTGSSLIVAAARGRRIELRRYRCDLWDLVRVGEK